MFTKKSQIYKFFIGLLFLFCAWTSFAVDLFNSENGQLTIPSVSVGSIVYTNVVITVGQVLSIGSAPAIGANDSYNASNGTLKIPIVNVSGQLYYNVVITLGSVINVGPSSSQTFTIAGNVTGLNSGQTLVLSNNANDTFNVVGGSLLNPFANSGSASFSFSSPVPYNGNYAVTIITQPVGQTCTVNNGTGFNVTNNVTNISVTCSGAPLTIGGTISGLPSGQSVTLLLNSGSPLTLSQTGQNIPFTFFQTITTNGIYFVTVGTQPINGTCTVSNGLGAGVTSNITNISVVCSTSITIGGQVTNSFFGQLTLLNNGGNPITILGNPDCDLLPACPASTPLNIPQSFTFSSPISSGSSYSVTVGTQPRAQTCSVNNGSGSNVTSNVSNITVSCSTNSYSIGGTLSGLTLGQQVTLLLNGGNPLIQTSSGSFVFPNKIPAGGSYTVIVGTQPLGQTCTVLNGVGSNVQSNISNIAVSCITNQYTIGGTLTGLASGQSVTLLNNGANSLTVSSNGNFTFSNSVASGGSYSVTVGTQPSGQNCTASNSSGSNIQSNVTNVSVNCATTTSYSVSVPATSGPWLVSANPSMKYDAGDVITPQPVSISLSTIGANSGQSINFQCVSGSIYISGNTPITCSSLFPSANNYNNPTSSIPNFSGLAYEGQIISSFANSSGVVIGTPFVISSTLSSYTVPMGATQILFGINDNFYYGNTGTLNVLLSTANSQKIKSVVAGNQTMLSLKSDGTLFGWGYNGSGEVGNGQSVNSTLSPIQISSGFSLIAQGQQQGAGIRNDGTLWIWGGWSGDINKTNSFSPFQFDSNSYINISTGHADLFAIRTDNTLWSMGDNYLGELGNGNTTNTIKLNQIGTGFAQVATSSSGFTTLGIKTDGTLWAWGDNSNFQFGNGTSTSSSIPVLIDSSAWKSVSGGWYSSAGIKSDGTLWVWGGSTTYKVPTKINSNIFVKLSLSGYGLLAIDSDGYLWSFSGQPLSPTQIDTNKYTDVSVGVNSVIALRSDGTIWAWGDNSWGQLGQGNTKAVTGLIQVPIP